jgi:hypothetical protein
VTKRQVIAMENTRRADVGVDDRAAFDQDPPDGGAGVDELRAQVQEITRRMVELGCA